jgi:hypothetical protein
LHFISNDPAPLQFNLSLLEQGENLTRSNRKLISLAFTVWFVASLLAAKDHDSEKAKHPPAPPTKTSNEKAIQLFKTKCLSCHVPGRDPYGMRLFDEVVGEQVTTEESTYADVTKLSLTRIRAGTMPPGKKEGSPLSEEEVALTTWLEHLVSVRETKVAKIKEHINHLTPGDEIRFRIFGVAEEKRAAFKNYLTAEDFGEDTIRVQNGEKESNVGLDRIEWFLPHP